MKHFSALTLSVITGLAGNAQLTVTDNLPAGDIADLLAGLNVTITNVQVNCSGTAMGHFSGTSELAITEGLILTTGDAAAVAGPVGNFASGMPGTPGDADLAASLGGAVTYDACVLEFDCIPNGDTLLFNFSFGSEEYQEFVGAGFNDVFAIYLSGPGFPTPTNVAALPDGTPVAINNVNATVNAGYYHDNEIGGGVNVAYDGFTTNLVVFAVVVPDADYHFKVAIADVSDGVFDSGVFLEAFSFRSNDISTRVSSLEASPLRMLRNGDQLTLMIPAGIAPNAEILVTNSTGQFVQQLRANSDRIELDMAGLESGLYTIQLFGDRTIEPVRFVKD